MYLLFIQVSSSTANTCLKFKKGYSAGVCRCRSTYLWSYVYLSWCVCFMDVFTNFPLFTFLTAGVTRIKLWDFTLPLLPSTSCLMSWDVTQSLLSARELFPPLCLKVPVPPTSIPSPLNCDQIVTTMLPTFILCVTAESCCSVRLCLWVCFFFGSVFWSCVFMGAYLHLLHFLHTPVLHTTPLYLCVSVMYKSIRYMWLCVCVWLCQYCIQSVYICQYLNLVWLRQLKPWNSILGGCQMQNASRTLQPRVWLCILYFCCSRLFIFF